MHIAIALITLLTVLLLATTAALVGRARGRYGVKAPATTGHEGFERAFRVQMNTQEAALMFLPALWVAASLGNPSVSAWIGATWLVGRVWYAWAYARAGNRGPGFVIGMLALLALLVQGGWSIVATLLLA
jgi:glutathione S-transferase